MSDGSHREDLYEAFAGAETDVEAQIDRGLEVTRRYLGLSVGALTRVADGTQRIEQVSGDDDTLWAGATCSLEESYCRRTVETDGSLAVRRSSSADPLSCGLLALHAKRGGRYPGVAAPACESLTSRNLP